MACVAVAAAVLCATLRRVQPELAGLCALVAGAMLLLGALRYLTDARDAFARVSALAGLSEGAAALALKAMGVAWVAELAVQACVDLGENGLAAKVTLCGRLVLFALAAPMLMSLLEMILELVP